MVHNPNLGRYFVEEQIEPIATCFAQISSGHYSSDKGAKSYFGVPILARGDKHAPGCAHNSIRSTGGVHSQTTMTSENDPRMITAPTSLPARQSVPKRSRCAGKRGAELALLPSCIYNMNARQNIVGIISR